MLINGKEILPKSGQPEKIQTNINKIEDLKADLKSENEPKKGEIYITDDGMGEVGFSLFDKDDEKGRERKIRYDYYKEMDTSEFIHRGLEIVADDSSQINPGGNAIKVYSDDEEVKTELEKLFIEKLDMNNELWSILFETCKMGDNFYEVVVNDYKKPKNVIFLRFLEPEKVDRIEENGRLSYYTYKTKEKGEDPREAKKYGYESGEEIIYKLQPWQIIHFKLENKGFNPYGASLLYSGLKTYRRLNLLEDVMIVYRLCLKGNSRIWTPNGYKEIRDIRENDIVYSLNNKNELEETKVLWQKNNGKKKLYKVSSVHRSIEATSNHPILVSDPKGNISYVDVIDLKTKYHKFLLPKFNNEEKNKLHFIEDNLSNTENIISIEEIGEDIVYDIEVASDSHNFIANGIPVHNSRAPERRVFYIDVGNLNKVEAKRFLEKVKNSYRTSSFIDENGNINKKARMLSITNDIFVPVREGQQGTKIETLQGGEALHNTDDMKYFRNKILRTMNIPPAYLGDDADRSRGCVAGNTLIKLVDGRDITIEEIAKEHEQGKQNYIYSIDKNKEWVIKPIAWAGITGNFNIIKVTLDNNEEIKCTPDHKFMLKDGSYCEAQNLKENTSLMPCYTRITENKRWNGYKEILNNSNKKWEKVHNIPFKEKKINQAVHHKDFNKINNNLDNLTIMNSKEHWEFHHTILKERWKDPIYRKKMCKREFITEKQILNAIEITNSTSLKEICNYLHVGRQTIRFVVQDLGYKDWVNFLIKKFGKQTSNINYKNITIKDIKNVCVEPNFTLKKVTSNLHTSSAKILEIISQYYKNWFEFITYESDINFLNYVNKSTSMKKVAKKMNCSVVTLRKKIRLLGYNNWNDFIFQATNHKVVSVNFCNEITNVYDITVDEETPNFALSCGIVIHNSLSQLDIKFSRFIERVQTQIIKGLNKIAALELFFAGYKKEQLNEFEIELTPPSNIKELTEIDLMGQKMNLLASIQGLNIFSNQWMLKNILKLSDAEIADIELYRRIEAQNAPPGEEVPGATGLPGTGSETPLPPGEEAPGLPPPEPGEAGVAPPEEETPGVPGTTPEEVVANTIMKALGKEFIVENQKDFFKLLRYINEKNNETLIESVEEWNQLKEDLGKIFIKEEVKPRTNNTKRQFIINEFGGIKFKNGNNEASIDLFESKKKNKETIYETKTIILG